MRNANLEDERRLHERGEFDTNVMFRNALGDRFHIKKISGHSPMYCNLYAMGQIIAESADTNELTVFYKNNLFAINRGNTQPSQKKIRTKPHVKGTRPEKLVPYDSNLMNKPRWVKLRDGRRAYTKLCGESTIRIVDIAYAWRIDGRMHTYKDHPGDVLGIYLPFEEWNTSENSTESADSGGWIKGSDVPKDGNSYFVKNMSEHVYVATWSFYRHEYLVLGSSYNTMAGWISAYKPITHEGLYKHDR